MAFFRSLLEGLQLSSELGALLLLLLQRGTIVRISSTEQRPQERQ
jgi:hypothetical protein